MKGLILLSLFCRVWSGKFCSNWLLKKIEAYRINRINVGLFFLTFPATMSSSPRLRKHFDAPFAESRSLLVPSTSETSLSSLDTPNKTSKYPAKDCPHPRAFLEKSETVLFHAGITYEKKKYSANIMCDMRIILIPFLLYIGYKYVFGA